MRRRSCRCASNATTATARCAKSLARDEHAFVHFEVALRVLRAQHANDTFRIEKVRLVSHEMRLESGVEGA